MKKKLLIATRMDFWRRGAGVRVRALSMARFLGRRTELTIAYLGPVRPNDERMLQATRGPWRFVCLDKSRPRDAETYARRLRALCGRERFDACIVDRLDLSYLREALPDGVTAFLDTHELVSVQGTDMRRYGYTNVPLITKQREFDIFRRFDGVILIQRRDYDEVRMAIGDHNAIMAPHPVV